MLVVVVSFMTERRPAPPATQRGALHGHRPPRACQHHGHRQSTLNPPLAPSLSRTSILSMPFGPSEVRRMLDTDRAARMFDFCASIPFRRAFACSTCGWSGVVAASG